MNARFAVEELPRDAQVARIEEWLRVRNAVDMWPISPESFALRASADVASLRLGARVGGRLVAVAAAVSDGVRAAMGEATMSIDVLPQERGRGIGASLFQRLMDFVRERGTTQVTSRVIAGDQRSLEFAGRRGLEIAGTQQIAVLQLDAGGRVPAAAPPEGISIVPIAKRPDLHRALYEHLVAVLPEVPSWGETPVPTWETWQAMIEEPSYRRELSLVALDGERIVGQVDVDDDGDGRAFITMLTVARDARRRGLARGLKLELARRASEAGWRVLVTINDGTNEPIRRLNEDLGYRYLPEVFLLHGPVQSS
jgi:GNAT superfamily N-acetyltransferase